MMLNSCTKFRGNISKSVTHNAVYPGIRPYVPPEIVEGEFQLMIYQTTVQRFTIKTPTVSEFEYYVLAYGTFYIIQIHYDTERTNRF